MITKLNFIMLDLLQRQWVLAGAVGQFLGGAAGIINGFAMIAIFAGLVAGAVGGFAERNVHGAKMGLYVAGFGACSWLIAQAMFQLAGNAPPITMSTQGL